MSGKVSFWYKVAAMLLALVLIAPVLAACDDDDDDEETTTAPTPVTSNTPAKTTPVSNEPIKIGVLGSWTGPAAMASYLADNGVKAVELYLEEQGGTVGGIPVEFIKYDDGSTVAGAVAQYAKAAFQDDVSIMLGAMTGANYAASTEESQKHKLPYISSTSIPPSLEDYPYATRAGGYNPVQQKEMWAEFIINELKPETVYLLVDNETTARNAAKILRPLLEDAGIEVIGDIYAEPATIDYSSYITKIKRAEPDMLIIEMQNAGGMAAMMQAIPEQGGWDDMIVCDTSGIGGFDAFLPLPGMEGTYHHLFCLPGLPYEGTALMDRLYSEGAGMLPTGPDQLYYGQLLAALAAIEGAGCGDREAIAEYMRSGNLTYLGPLGPIHVRTDGENDFRGLIAKVVNGQWVAEPSTLP